MICEMFLSSTFMTQILNHVFHCRLNGNMKKDQSEKDEKDPNEPEDISFTNHNSFLNFSPKLTKLFSACLLFFLTVSSLSEQWIQNDWFSNFFISMASNFLATKSYDAKNPGFSHMSEIDTIGSIQHINCPVA